MSDKKPSRSILPILTGWFEGIREPIAVVLLTAAFALTSFLTIENAPHPWGDEPPYSDPAINLAVGKGFRSGSWYAQNSQEFFAGNVPLHQITLAGWLKIVGIGVWQVRSINILWVTVAILLLWWFIRSANILRFAPTRIAFVALLLGSLTIDMATRLARPDGITIFLFAAALAVSRIERKLVRIAALILVSTLFPFAGLQLFVYAVLFCGLIFLLTGWKYFGNLVACGIGVILGVALLLSMYFFTGSIDGFIASILPHASGGGPQTSKYSGFVADPSLWLLTAAIFLTLIWSLLRGTLRWRGIFVFGVAALIFMPLGMIAAGKFSHHYTWMVYIPGLAGVLSAIEEPKCPNWLRWPVVALTGLAACLGLPKTLALIVRDGFPKPADRVDEWLAGRLNPNDYVFCDMAAYYTAKATSREVFTRFYLNVIRNHKAPQGEAEQVNVLIIVPENASETMNSLPGNWVMEDEKSVFGVSGIRSSKPFALQLWRRAIPSESQ